MLYSTCSFYNFFFPQQTIGQRMSLEPNSTLWSIPCGLVSTLAASLGTCAHYGGGIATGSATCSDNRVAGSPSPFRLHFPFLTLNQKKVSTGEGPTLGYTQILAKNLMVHSFLKEQCLPVPFCLRRDSTSRSSGPFPQHKVRPAHSSFHERRGKKLYSSSALKCNNFLHTAAQRISLGTRDPSFTVA